MSESPQQEVDAITAARRELHELTVLASALLRLATKVHSRCEVLRTTLGDPNPIGDAEVDRIAPPAGAGPRADSGEDEDPVALLATSMVLDGKSRNEIAVYLRSTFGLTDTDALLDRVTRDAREPQ